MKKTVIAITGASGFLGKYLVAALKGDKRYLLRLFDRHRQDLTHPESLEEFLQGASTVIHLAGANRESDAVLLHTNLLGTAGLLIAIARYCPNTKLIMASSVQVDWPNSFYGLTKKLAEEIINYYTQQISLKAIILRIANIYGVGGRPFYNSVLATFTYQLKQGELPTIHGDARQKRDYIYVGDVVQAFLAALKLQSVPCQVCNICSGKRVSLREVIATFENIFGHSIKIQHEESPININLPIPKVDYRIAKQILGWRPQTTLIDGLRKLVNE